MRGIEKKTIDKKRIIENYKESPKYLNIGGERFTREHWRVLDYITPNSNYGSIFVDFNIDLEECEQWVIRDGSYDLVYSSHTLEHLSPKAVNWTLKEAYRVLKKGGGIRIVVPDIDLFLSHYKAKDWSWLEIKYPKENIEKSSLKLKEMTVEDVLIWLFATSLRGRISSKKVKRDIEAMSKIGFLNKYIKLIKSNWQRNTSFHRNWFDFKKLERLLRNAGFSQIIKNYDGQSIFTEFLNKEFDKSSPEIALFIDAKKI